MSRGGFLDAVWPSVARNVAAWRERSSGLGRHATPPPPFLPPRRPFGVIAEVKRRSPSRGDLLGARDPVALARAYEAGGAEAVSVVVEEEHFGGSPELFASVRGAVDLPLLWKDFVVDPFQVELAARLGASAVLLIAAFLPARELAALAEAARGAGLRPLVEVHSREEAAAALEGGADLVGVNHRDLVSLKVDLGLSREVAPLLAGVQSVAESGLSGARDVRAMRSLGFRAVLVGESLVTATDTASALRDMVRAGVSP